jgi:hypothetical protein
VLKTLSFVQEYLSKDINQIKYIDNLKHPRYQGNLSKKIGIDYWSMINPPPLNGEKETTSDLTQVIKYANSRTIAETTLVLDVDKDPLVLFSNLMAEHNIDFPYKDFADMYAFLSEIVTDLKYYYNRPRPKQLAMYYNLNLDVLRTETHHTPSYPSGHTAYASLIAAILAEIKPELSDNLWKIAGKCGHCRVMQGVHFIGDNMASLQLVRKVYKPLKEFNQYIYKRN